MATKRKLKQENHHLRAMITMEQWKSSILQSELRALDNKITKLEEELKLERDINSFDRKVRTKNYDL
jgi:hypothetical protein